MPWPAASGRSSRSDKSKRTDAARWVNEIFTTFYRDEKLLEARDIYEYEYWTILRHAVELRVTDRHVQPNDAQRQAIRAVDLILNFLEQLVYLEWESHIAVRDREVFFAYWFGILKYPSRAGLRRYLANCGYERCAAIVNANSGELVVGEVPASLIGDAGTPAGQVQVPGIELPQGVLQLNQESPHQNVICTAVTDMGVFRRLDEHFGYDPADPHRSPVLRVCLPTLDSAHDVWVYIEAKSASILPIILPEAGGGYRFV